MPDDKPNHKGYCECPLLQFAAEAGKLAMYGMESQYYQGLPIVIAVLRDKHGCRGPDRRGMCHWNNVAVNLSPSTIYRTETPWIIPKPDDDGKGPGVYL